MEWLVQPVFVSGSYMPAVLNRRSVMDSHMSGVMFSPAVFGTPSLSTPSAFWKRGPSLILW